MNPKKILLLGSTGRTGKLLLEELLKRKYSINILVRDGKKITIKSDLLSVFEGMPSDINDVKKALSGCSVIFSALNISRTSDFPWAKLRTPKDFLKQTVQNIIKLSESYSIDNLIVISAWGVAETRNDIPFWFRWMIDFTNVKHGYLGHEDQERLLKESDLNWTIVRPVILTNNKIIEPVLVSLENIPKPNYLISRLNVANFMVDIFENNLHVKQTPTISI